MNVLVSKEMTKEIRNLLEKCQNTIDYLNRRIDHAERIEKRKYQRKSYKKRKELPETDNLSDIF